VSRHIETRELENQVLEVMSSEIPMGLGPSIQKDAWQRSSATGEARQKASSADREIRESGIPVTSGSCIVKS
jgi:hypothetical protein